MSGGGGGGRQMPMASNQGQQMQNPQMGQQMGVGQGGMFGQGGTTMQTNQPPGMMGGQIAPMQVGQQVSGQPMMGGGGMGPTPSFANQQAYDDFMAQGGMQGVQDRMAGIGALGGGQMPQQGMTKQQYFEMYGSSFRPGMTMIDDSGMGRGFPGGPPLVQNPGPGRSYPINDGPMMPPGSGYPQPTNTTMPMPRRGADGVGDGTGPGGMGFGFPRNPPPDPRFGFDDFRKGDLPGRGMPPGYGPTKGPIDGRKLRDMMDIRTRRPMDNLPNALENNLPPSLKRPTQNRRG